MVEKLLDIVLKEASVGRIEFGDMFANVRFDTAYNQNFIQGAYPVLQIRDRKQFVDKVTEYIECLQTVPSRYKLEIVNLFSDATWEDFRRPIEYINRRISFVKNPLLEDGTIKGIETLDGADIKFEVKRYIHETPYCFKSYVTKDDDVYELPTISYGIEGDTCYVYAIQNYQKSINTQFQKRIKRRLYRLNDGLVPTDNPEDILNVSPAAVLCLSVFLNELQKHGIKKIIAIAFLPIRYNSKKEAIQLEIDYRAKNWSEQDRLQLKEEKRQEHLRIQNNLTQKFIRSFNRLTFHFPNIEITAFPWIEDENLNLQLDEFTESNNEILQEIINKGKVIDNGKSL